MYEKQGMQTGIVTANVLPNPSSDSTEIVDLMGFDNPFGYRQTEATAFIVLVAGFIHAVKPIKDLRQGFFGIPIPAARRVLSGSSKARYWFF